MRYLLSLFFFIPTSSLWAISIAGIIEASFIQTHYDEVWLNSWQNSGVGLTRFDKESDQLELTQALLEFDFDLASATVFKNTGVFQSDGDRKLGLTESYIEINPLSDGLRHRFRVGGFYPAMSVENISVGWTSPFTYTFSAINSWIAEELRTIGAEWSVKRPGSQYNSPHTFTWTTAIYGFNDPVGTLLTWRGWALHNRQTPFSDRVDFANYPSVDTGIMAGQPAWVEPFREIDGNLGYYLGVRWKYLNQSDIKIYYYDNNGDGTETEPSGQYAWETEFESLAWRYRLTRKTLLLSQWMRGHTRMGIGNAAHVDYTAWYAMLSLRMRQHRFSIRYDDFKVSELDDYPADPNASDGSAWTAAWRYRIHRQLETGIEYLTLSSWNDNRSDFGWPRKETQSQVLIVFQYRFSH